MALAGSLVVLGSSATALAVARDAHHRGLDPVIVDTSRGVAFHTRLARTCDLASAREDDVTARICAWGGRGANHLVATSDSWLRFIVERRGELAAAFQTILHPDNPALAVCLDKACFSAWCRQHGFRTPGSWAGSELPAELALGYPLVVRPANTLHDRRESDGSQLPKAVEVASREDLLAWIARYASAQAAPLVSESLLGHRLTQYSVAVARAAGRMLSFVAVKRRPGPASCATGTYVELEPEPIVERFARRVMEALDYFGIGEVEILHSHDTGENHLIEVNARPWLQYGLASASGRDFLGWVLGGKRSAPSRARSRGVRWLDFRSDLHVCFSRSDGMVRSGQIGWWDYLRSIARANAHATLDFADWRPRLRGGPPLRARLP